MGFKLRVHANSSQEKLVDLGEDKYEIWIKEKPFDGKANLAIEKSLKKYFDKNIKIVKGLRSNNKVFEILD